MIMIPNITTPAVEQVIDKVDSGDQVELSIRQEAIRDSALKLGAQKGYMAMATQINKILAPIKDYLDTTYDFNVLMLPHHLLPPVVMVADDTTNVTASHTSVFYNGLHYRIAQRAYFRTTPLSWRDYLILHPKSIDDYPLALMPKDDEEQAILDKAVHYGWSEGMNQALTVFYNGLRRLTRDYAGMLRYHILYSKNMVTAPIVTIAVDSLSHSQDDLSIDNRNYMVSTPALFNQAFGKWQPSIIEVSPSISTTQKQNR